MLRTVLYNRFYRIAAVSASLMVILLAVMIILGKNISMPVPEMYTDDGEISSWGPIKLSFQDPMLFESVEERILLMVGAGNSRDCRNLQSDEAIPVVMEWKDKELLLWPERPLMVDHQYTVCLMPGSQSAAGMVIDELYTEILSVRTPEVLYLGNATSNPELWLATVDGNMSEQITATNGRIYDFDVSYGGDQVIYSVIREDELGTDLWVWNRYQDAHELILTCEDTWCIEPSMSRDGSRIAYSQQKGVGYPIGSQGSEIWLLDLNTSISQPLYDKQVVYGYQPNWSPNGRYLAFIDSMSGIARIYDFEAGKDMLLRIDSDVYSQHSTGVGHWSLDGNRLLFGVSHMTLSGQPKIGIYEMVFESGDVHELFDATLEENDYSLPVLSPVEDLVVVGARVAMGWQSKQIWIMGLDGSDKEIITTEQQYHHAAYSWYPDGSGIVYQRINVSTSQAKPEVLIWWKDTNEFLYLAEDAAMPVWLP